MNTENRESRQAKRQRPSLLEEVLERRMLLYVLAAGATLAGASSAQAKAVFTRSDFVLSLPNGHLAIDLNNDGTTDFILIDHCVSQTSCFGSVNITARGYGQNGVEQMTMGRRQEAAALTIGDKIGPAAAFKPYGFMLYGSIFSGTHSFGPFAHTGLRFLGVSFLINGQVHYGWIGFRSVDRFTAKLLGWAYETLPNTPISAGQGSRESDALSSTEPTSLELLATGHVAVADWRRRTATMPSVSGS
jgi:hypothetical protein